MGTGRCSSGDCCAAFAVRVNQRWADRSLKKEVFERFGYRPVTTDSHFSEYAHWAQDVVDHQGILGFYHGDKVWCFKHSPIRVGGTEETEYSADHDGSITL